jgi:hypothetical protein
MISRKLIIIVNSTIGWVLLTCGLARANLVTNGGFELYTGTAPKGSVFAVQPTDWSGGGYAFVDAPGTADDASLVGVPPVWGPFPATSPQFGNFIQADGSSGLDYPLSQTINGLTAGQSYTVSFYQAAGQQLNDYGATTEFWQVTLGSDTQASAVMNTPSAGVFPWESQSLTLTADNTSDVLSFLAVGSGGLPPYVFLDGVDMESNVPEPSAALLLGGVGMVLMIGRLGRRMMGKRSATAV